MGPIIMIWFAIGVLIGALPIYGGLLPWLFRDLTSRYDNPLIVFAWFFFILGTAYLAIPFVYLPVRPPKKESDE